MAIILKSKEEREKIRETGRIVADILAEMRSAVHPGVTTAELDAIAVEGLKQRGAKSGTLKYRGYPASVCISVNDEIVHGIPGKRILHEGDIVSLDFVALYNGWYADSTITVPVGTVSQEVQRLLKVTQDALDRGIAAACAGSRLVNISHTIQHHVEAAGFSIVRKYGGHGVGRSMHEDPQVLNYMEPGQQNPVLKPGMVIAIEPMVNMGVEETRIQPDKWTVVTADGRYAAHFEHTIAITTGDADILTL